MSAPESNAPPAPAWRVLRDATREECTPSQWRRGPHVLVRCTCCGEERVVEMTRLRRGKTKNCGRAVRERAHRNHAAFMRSVTAETEAIRRRVAALGRTPVRS